MKIVDRKFKIYKKRDHCQQHTVDLWNSLLYRSVDAQSLQGFMKQLEKSMEDKSIRTIETKAFS